MKDVENVSSVKLFKDIFVMFKLLNSEKSPDVCGLLFLAFCSERLCVIYLWKMIYRNLRM